ncbi:Uncharacterised protein [uncultured archaeon]|nr:Uncharacterised protein [uncultured archaeon]
MAVPIRNVSAGNNFTFGAVSLEIFNPPAPQFSQSPEANSVVMRVWYNNFCAFLPGDIENEQHASIVGKVGSRRCDVYKWPYHGRGSPQASLLFDRFQPSNAVISVGANDLGLPSSTTLERLRISNTKIWRTDTDGDVYVHVDENGNFNISANLTAE